MVDDWALVDWGLGPKLGQMKEVHHSGICIRTGSGRR